MRLIKVGLARAAVLALVTGAAFTGSASKIGSRDISATPGHTSPSAQTAAPGENHGPPTPKALLKDSNSNIGPQNSSAPGHTSPSAQKVGLTHGSSTAKVMVKDVNPNSKPHESSAPGRTISSAHKAGRHGSSTSEVPLKGVSHPGSSRHCVPQAGKHGSYRPNIRPRAAKAGRAHGRACCACGKMPRRCASRGRASLSAKKAGTSPLKGKHGPSTPKARLQARQEDFEEQVEEEPLTVGQKIDLCIWNVKEFGYKVREAPSRLGDFIKYSCCCCCCEPPEEEWYDPPDNRIMPSDVEMANGFPDGYDVQQLRTHLHQFYPEGDRPVMTDHAGQGHQYVLRNYPEAPHFLPWEYPVSVVSPEHQEFHGEGGAELHPYPVDYGATWGWATKDPYASPRNPMPERQPAYVPGKPVEKRDLRGTDVGA